MLAICESIKLSLFTISPFSSKNFGKLRSRFTPPIFEKFLHLSGFPTIYSKVHSRKSWIKSV